MLLAECASGGLLLCVRVSCDDRVPVYWVRMKNMHAIINDVSCGVVSFSAEIRRTRHTTNVACCQRADGTCRKNQAPFQLSCSRYRIFFALLAFFTLSEPGSKKSLYAPYAQHMVQKKTIPFQTCVCCSLVSSESNTSCGLINWTPPKPIGAAPKPGAGWRFQFCGCRAVCFALCKRPNEVAQVAQIFGGVNTLSG